MRHCRYLRRGSTNIIVIITILAILVMAGIVVKGYLKGKRTREFQKNYAPCYQNLCHLEKALIAYAREHKGIYPKSLKELTPKYIKAIPTCPEAGSDTYSSSYLAIKDRPMYFIACEGTHHKGPADTPQTVSDPGFLSVHADNPMTVVYENGSMKEIMKMLEQANGLIRKGNYRDALEECRKMLKIQKEKREEIYVKMARCYFQTGEDRKAFDALADAAETSFDLQEWLRLKSFLFKPENQDSLIRVLKKCYKGGADDVGCALMLTKALEESGDDSEAKKIYQRGMESGAALKVSPVAELYYSGQVSRIEGKKDEALAAFLSIRDVQTENKPAENYICTLAEEQIRKIKGLPDGPAAPDRAHPSPSRTVSPPARSSPPAHGAPDAPRTSAPVKTASPTPEPGAEDKSETPEETAAPEESASPESVKSPDTAGSPAATASPEGTAAPDAKKPGQKTEERPAE